MLKRRAAFRPMDVLDVDLATPRALPDARHPDLRVLVRLGGVPVGFVDLPRDGDEPLGRRIVTAASARHGDMLIRTAVRNALEWPLPAPPALEPVLLLAPPVAEPPRLTITVAVCTRDRPDDLGRCLDALGRLEWPALDLLVVDNAPATDASRRLVADRFPHVRYVLEPRPGLDWARNRAIAEARGDVVAYADDDVVVDPGWARALAAAFADDDVMAVTGFVAPWELETEAQSAFEDHRGYQAGFERAWHHVDRAAGERAAVAYGAIGQIGTGANMAYRRTLFDRIGGFDPALDVGTRTQGGGDLEMFFRVVKEGYTLVREPRAVLYHRNRRSWAELRSQISTWGSGMYAYVTRSWLAYPEERPGLAWIVARWLVLRNTRRLLRSAVNPLIHTQLVWDEMKRSALAPFLYRSALRRVREIEREFGAGIVPASAARSEPPLRQPGTAAPFSCSLDLADLPRGIDAGAARDVHVHVSWAGQAMGTVRFRAWGAPIGTARLRDGIARHLAPRILREAGTGPAALLASLPDAIAAQVES